MEDDFSMDPGQGGVDMVQAVMQVMGTVMGSPR